MNKSYRREHFWLLDAFIGGKTRKRSNKETGLFAKYDQYHLNF
jgi:hypothetical protein